MNDFFALIKFGQKEHLESLRDNGIMRFGAIESFQSSSESERGDRFEGATNILNGQFTEIECNHPTLGRYIFTPARNTTGEMIIFNDDPLYSFSSYALTTNCFKDKEMHKVDSKMLVLGEYALVITEPIIFLEKVKHYLMSEKIIFSYKECDYKDYSIEGEIRTNLFTKPNDLAHQREHRILMKTGVKKEAIFIEIGSIKDFCFLSRADEIIQMEFKGKKKLIS